MKKPNQKPESPPLRVLILEDNPVDTELIERELRRAGFVFLSRLVEGEKNFGDSLAEFQPQIILSDFKLPTFSGLAALQMVRLWAPDVPFIFVSGSIGEEKAIELLAQGASDYVLKDNLARLGPAVNRALAASALEKQKIEAEKSLRESEEKYRSLVEASPDAIIIVDAGGSIAFASNRAFDMFAMPAETPMLGVSILDFVDANEIPRVRERLVEILSGQSRTEIREYRMRKRDGQPFWGEVSSTSLQDALGKRTGLLLVCRDVTERKRMENEQKLAKNALQDAHDRLETTMKAIPDLLFEVDLSGRIYDYNAPRDGALYVAPENFLGKTIDDVIPAEAARIIHEALADAFRNGLHRGSVYMLDLPNGPAWFELSIACKGEIGEADSRFVVTARDISARHQAEERIRVSLKEKEVLLQEIHHRVKNNLQIISGLLTMQENQASQKPLAEIFRESQDRIRSIALIHEKLYRSQNLAEIDFSQYLRDLAENLLTSHAIAAGRVTARYDMEPIFLSIEKAMPLGLIANELITNAMKHAFPAGRKGEICIALQGCRDRSRPVPTDQDHASNYELSIADDGVGLPENFAPQDQNSLGLYLVNLLVRQLNADLNIERDGGTKFLIRFADKIKGLKTG